MAGPKAAGPDPQHPTSQMGTLLCGATTQGKPPLALAEAPASKKSHGPCASHTPREQARRNTSGPDLCARQGGAFGPVCVCPVV